jgi:antitoxin component YwqK of YwqJK toxin-antitoxin module
MILTIGAVLLIWIFDKKIIDNEYVATKIVRDAGIQSSPVEKLNHVGHQDIKWVESSSLFVNPNKQNFEGSYKTFFQNGQIKWVVPFVDGKADGTVLVFGRKGKKRWEQAYKQGKPHGFWIKYDPLGSLQLKGKFYNGRKDSVWSLYYPDGSVRYRIEFDHGKVLHEQYFQNGKAK